jgi:hypothetical protein
MNFRAGYLASLFSSLLWMSACGSDFNRAAQDLDNRMQVDLAPDIAANRVVVERLPDGERVTLVDPLLFSSGGKTLNGHGQDVLIDFVHGLLEPRIYTLQVAEVQDMAPQQKGARSSAVERYFSDVGFGAQLRPYSPVQELPTDGVGSTRSGVAMTVRLLPVEICRLNQGPLANCP